MTCSRYGYYSLHHSRADGLQLLQRTFPGQMPSVRRDIHNAIVPLDFTDPKSARLLVDTIQGIIKRRVPLRWGAVPVSSTVEGEKQARIIYHLQDSYGLVPVVNYLQKVSY
jgi:UDP-glucose:glycoprotein glucosyltransferase